MQNLPVNVIVQVLFSYQEKQTFKERETKGRKKGRISTKKKPPVIHSFRNKKNPWTSSVDDRRKEQDRIEKNRTEWKIIHVVPF